MLSVIKDLFFNFMELASSLVDILIERLKDVVYLIKLLGEFAIKLPTYFTWIPNNIYYVIGTMLSIVILYKILGREG